MSEYYKPNRGAAWNYGGTNWGFIKKGGIGRIFANFLLFDISMTLVYI